MSRRFSCKEIADRYSVSTLTVWAWIREKKLPAIHLEKGYSIREEDLDEFERQRMTVKKDA